MASGKRGAEENMALGARFQKLRGRGAVLNSQKGIDARGLPCFPAYMLFLWQHCC